MRTLLTIAAAWPAMAGAQFVGRIDAPAGRPPSLLRADTRGPYVPAALDRADIARRIDDGRDAGRLSRREARLLRRENRQLAALSERYGRDGLSAAEASELEMRAGVLRAQVDARRTR